MKRYPETPAPLGNDLLLDALLEHSADMIYYKDTQGRFIRVSRSMARRFGRSDPQDLVGKTDRDFFSSEHAEQAAVDEVRILATGQPLEGVIEKETWPDGSVTWVSTSKLPLRNPAGRVIGIHGISRDVTAQHKMSDELARVAEDLRVRNAFHQRDIKLAAEVFELFGAHMPEALPAGVAPDAAPVRCAFHYEPAAVLGGDFYLVLPQPRGGTRLLVCDVMGHGMQSALVAVLVRSWAQLTSPACATLTAWMEGLNARLVESFLMKGSSFMATALALDIDHERGHIEFVSAGHPSPLWQVARDHQVASLIAEQNTGPGLGLLPDAAYRSLPVTWSPGDRIVLYTDGLIECRNATGDEFETHRIVALLQANATTPLHGLLSQLMAAVAQHRGANEFEDDVCVVVLERGAST